MDTPERIRSLRSPALRSEPFHLNVKCDIHDPQFTAGTGLRVREEMSEGTSNGGLHQFAQTDKLSTLEFRIEPDDVLLRISDERPIRNNRIALRLSCIEDESCTFFAGSHTLAPVFADLNKYAATMHFVGQSTILSLTSDRGTGEAYCLAHHLTVDGDKRKLMVAALRYYDTFVKLDGSWLFAERLLYVDWIEERPLS